MGVIALRITSLYYNLFARVLGHTDVINRKIGRSFTAISRKKARNIPDDGFVV